MSSVWIQKELPRGALIKAVLKKIAKDNCTREMSNLIRAVISGLQLYQKWISAKVFFVSFTIFFFRTTFYFIEHLLVGTFEEINVAVMLSQLKTSVKIKQYHYRK